jgi:hypothetical protein
MILSILFFSEGMPGKLRLSGKVNPVRKPFEEVLLFTKVLIFIAGGLLVCFFVTFLKVPGCAIREKVNIASIPERIMRFMDQGFTYSKSSL